MYDPKIVAIILSLFFQFDQPPTDQTYYNTLPASKLPTAIVKAPSSIASRLYLEIKDVMDLEGIYNRRDCSNNIFVGSIITLLAAAYYKMTHSRHENDPA